MQSIIIGYLYLLTKRSIASAILFHYFVNLAGEFFEKNIRFELFSLLFYGVIASVIMILVYMIKQKRNSDVIT